MTGFGTDHLICGSLFPMKGRRLFLIVRIILSGAALASRLHGCRRTHIGIAGLQRHEDLKHRPERPAPAVCNRLTGRRVSFYCGFSIAFILHSPFLLLFSLVFIPAWIYMCVAEERDLVIRYGQSYEEYKKRTGFWFPKRGREGESKQ